MKSVSKLLQKRIGRGVLVGLAAFGLGLLAFFFQVARPLEWKSWDLRLRLFSDRDRASRDIVLFLIDQHSLDFFEEQQGLAWPWPRQLYSAVIDYLRTGGAKSIFFDLIFSESSRSGTEDDEDFARAIERAGNVFLPLSLSQEEAPLEEERVEALERFSIPPQVVPEKSFPSAASASLPVPTLLSASRGAGNVVFAPDSDGIFRRLPLIYSYQRLYLPSVALALAQFIRGGERLPDIPLDASGRMIIRYYGPTGTYKTYSIAALINSWAQLEEGHEPQVPPAEFAGKTVLIGGSASGIYDLRPTPLSAVFPGVEIHATALDNILQGDFIRIQPRSVFIALLLAFALLAAVGASWLKKVWQLSFFLALCLALPFVVSWLAFSAGVWLEFVIPEFAVLAGFIGSSLLSYSAEGRQRRFIKSVFRHYLSPDVIERVIANPSLLRLGGEKREITSFFSDVAGFTAISEALSPEELVSLLNEYLSEMTGIILHEGGTLDKYEGDAIIAFWNAPLDQPDHALRACRAALGCQKRLAEMSQKFEAIIGKPLAMRIGLNSGPAVVGNMGSSRRFDYTAMGDTVNLASRLEGACKLYRLPILVGEETYRFVKDGIFTREVDIIRVVGKAKPVVVYEIFGEKGEVAESELENLRIFEAAREAYKRREWDRARELFRKLKADPLAELFAERCLSLKASPPPADWDGVYVLKEK